MARALAASTLKRFRKLLEDEQTRLAEVIRDIDEAQEDLRLSETSAERSPDPNTAEGGSLVFEIEKELSLYENAKGLLAQAGEALQRIDEGTYGICADCSKRIPAARLQVKPEAARCVACQAEYERRSVAGSGEWCDVARRSA